MRHITAATVLLCLQGCRMPERPSPPRPLYLEEEASWKARCPDVCVWYSTSTDVSWYTSSTDPAVPTDQIDAQVSYRDGKREGIWAAWYPNGQRQVELLFREDKRVGRASWWLEDGTLYASGIYSGGEPWDGTFAEDLPRGIYEKLTYEHGTLTAGEYPEWQKVFDRADKDPIPLREVPTRRGDLSVQPDTDTYLFEGNWYPKHMAAFGVPRLGGFAASAGATCCLRFVWLRTFDRPVCITAVLSATDCAPCIEARVLDGKGGYSPGGLAQRSSVLLSEEQARDLVSAIKGSRLLSASREIMRDGLDGSQWIFEFVDGTQYLVRNYWSPLTKPDVVGLGRRLLDLTGLGDEEVY